MKLTQYMRVIRDLFNLTLNESLWRIFNSSVKRKKILIDDGTGPEHIRYLKENLILIN